MYFTYTKCTVRQRSEAALHPVKKISFFMQTYISSSFLKTNLKRNLQPFEWKRAKGQVFCAQQSSKITLGKEKKREQGGRKDEKKKSNGCTLSSVYFFSIGNFGGSFCWHFQKSGLMIIKCWKQIKLLILDRVTVAPFTRVRTNFWTDKNLHRSAFRSHGTRRAVHVFERQTELQYVTKFARSV